MNSVTDAHLVDVDKMWSRQTAVDSPLPGGVADRCPNHEHEQVLLIERSRQRSLTYGLTGATEPENGSMLTALPQLIEKSRALHTHAMPVMETLHQQILNTHSMVVLADAEGVILHVVGDEDFVKRAGRVSLRAGTAWSEQARGTNAIGTAIEEQKPVSVRASEHFLRANEFLAVVAAPIFDRQGRVTGVLGIAGDERRYQPHTMALARMSAQMIENQLFSARLPDAVTLHFHQRPEYLGTLTEGIAVFTAAGKFLSANRSAQQQLDMPLSALQAHTFSSLFGLPLSSLVEHHRMAGQEPLAFRLHSGGRAYGRASWRPAQRIFEQAAKMTEVVGTAPADAWRRTGLRHLKTGDPQVEALVDKAGKIVGRGIPVLLIGETGTGKELLAQAIHNDSHCAKGPFVAINCASIPETLIEAELFGYEDGAFTGSRKKGSAGKIQQADGGTLFLDEIGDMPLNLQAHLLRILQERVVTPLGSARSIPVNIEVICATNRNLRELIANGKFRDDLYYRLNGLVLKLPALRDRTDLITVVARILKIESAGITRTVAPEVMQLFSGYRWPGNFRQLRSVLRFAVIMAGQEAEIRREHLPDEFIDDVMAPVRSKPVECVEQRFTAGTGLDEMELSAILRSLEAHGGNVSAAARALGISRNTIYRKIGADKTKMK